MIKIYKFYDAPKEYQELSTSGGDEDWIAIFPESYLEYIPYWLEKIDSMGEPQKFIYQGQMVYIGCH